jgi:hypothetical protein
MQKKAPKVPNSLKNYLIYAAAISLIMIYAERLRAQDDLPTNTKLFHALIEASMEEVAGYIDPDLPVSVSVHFTGYDWFIRHRMVNILQEAGFSVMETGQDPAEGITALEAGIEYMGVRYSGLKRRSFLGKRVMTRSVESVITFRISGSGGERILRTAEEIVDTIPFDSKANIENPALPFTSGELPGGSMTEKYLGPAVIITVTGAVVYLFFSVRS